MRFAAGLAAKAVLWLFVLSILQDEIYSAELDSKNWEKCDEECGGTDAVTISEEKGELLCFMPSSGGYYKRTPCLSTCMDEKPAQDQLKCWIGYCTVARGNEFCEKPGMSRIKKHQCKEFLSSGKAKFYGRSCSYGNTPAN